MITFSKIGLSGGDLGEVAVGFFVFVFVFNKSDFLGLGAFSEVNLTCLGYWDLF